MPSFFPATLGVMLALAVRCRGHAYFVHFEGRQTHPVAVSTDGARLFALNTPHARLSGNGTLSCASCHINADRDGLAWDLGDPGGVMGTAPGKNLASGNTTTVFQRPMHPMKGPMLTPTLRNAYTGAAYNWRGDAPLAALGSHFVSKLGGSALTAPEWQVFIE